MILIEESGEGAGDAGQQVYLRETNGAPAVLLGPAASLALFSPDEQSVLASTPDARGVVIYPVGPGQPRRIDLPSYNVVTRAGLFRMASACGLSRARPDTAAGLHHRLERKPSPGR